MPSVSTNVFVPRRPTEVFDFLADARNLALWSSGVTSVEQTHVVPGVNACYRYRYPGRHRPHLLVCADFEPCRRIAFRGQRMWSPLGTQVPLYAFDLLPHADGTLVRLSVTSSLSAALLLLGPVIAMAWRRDLPADSRKFRELLGGARIPVEETLTGTPVAPVPVADPAPAPAPAAAAGPAAAPAPAAADVPVTAATAGPPVGAAAPMTTPPPHGFDYAH